MNVMKFKGLLFSVKMILLLILSSCADDFFKDESVTEGIAVNLTIPFQSEENIIQSRVERDPVDENRVENIYLFIFNPDGNVHARKFCTEGKGLSYSDGSSDHDSGFLQLETTSINGATIACIANITTESSSTAYELTLETLNSIDNISKLLELGAKLRSTTVERGMLFLMSGYAVDGSGQKTVNISSTNNNLNLSLKRLDAKVKFVLKAEPKNQLWTAFSFTPRSWVVKRVPNQSLVFEKEKGDYEGSDALYFTSSVLPFEVKDDVNGHSFVFYMPENRKAPSQNVEDYGQRDKWEKVDENKDKIFINANSNSTYVELTGVLSYVNEFGKSISADVKLTVHLGNTTSDFNDYNTYRNVYYTYNVKIKGIDDISIEVNDNNEKRPGFEGDVVSSDAKVFEFDSHYDRILITLNPKNVGDKIYWSVNTPFSRGVHEITANEIENNTITIADDMKDYRWIKFAVNEEYGVRGEKYVKYPGDQNYNDPFPVSGQPNNQSSPYFNQGEEGYKNEYSDILGKTINTEDARLMDIHQLMIYLKKLKDRNVESDLYVTAFVDENLYFKNPITGEEDNEHRSLWKLTTDKEDRMLHLIVEEVKFSGDGNSSIVKAQYSFRQRGIQTIFNVEKPELKTAWGLESKMETERLSPGGVQNGDSPSNGRQNTLKSILGNNYENNVKWTDIIGTGNAYEFKGDQTAVRACMLRNRDLNGDNIVQPKEIRWYLASIDQLTDIYLGEYALDEQSRLYPRNAADRNNQVRWHYTSSSNYSDNNSWILWAEEGASKGSSSGSIKDDNSENKLFSYRCVRNLGISLDYPEETPVDLVSIDKDTYPGQYLIDMTNMNPKARRDIPEVGALSPHNERQDLNRPYAKFLVAEKDYPEPESNATHGGDDYLWLPPYSSENDAKFNWFTNSKIWTYYQTDNKKDGYRIPNQRELLIMASRLPADVWNKTKLTRTWWYVDGIRKKQGSETQEKSPFYYSQTSFSLNGKSPYVEKYQDKRKGFIWNPNDKVFFLMHDENSEKGYIRMVKDVD